MKLPGFAAEASLNKTDGGRWWSDATPPRQLQLVPQLGFGTGVTYPPGDDDCYCCSQWVRCPCGLTLG